MITTDLYSSILFLSSIYFLAFATLIGNYDVAPGETGELILPNEPRKGRGRDHSQATESMPSTR